jgi:protein required for attachment to host cells
VNGCPIDDVFYTIHSKKTKENFWRDMMSPVLVVVADGAKARFFTLEVKERARGELGSYLLEDETLVNPDQMQQGQQLWSGPESQAGHFQEGKGQAHSYDDRRRDHEVEFERRFAQSITGQILSRTQPHSLQSLLLIAEPRALGLLRKILIPVLPKALKLSELDKNLCHLKPQELYEYLAKRDLLAHA